MSDGVGFNGIASNAVLINGVLSDGINFVAALNRMTLVPMGFQQMGLLPLTLCFIFS